MAIDFPNSPTIGDLFSVGNTVFEWTGSVWRITTTNYGYTPNIDGGLYNSNFGGIVILDAGSV